MRSCLHNAHDLTFLARFKVRARPLPLVFRTPALLEPFRDLKRQQFTKKAPHTHAGVVIAANSDNVLFLLVISTIWTIERQFHKARERNGASIPYLPRNSLADLIHLNGDWCGSSYES